MGNVPVGESWIVLARSGLEAIACLAFAFVVLRLVRRRRDLSFGSATLALLIALGVGACAHLLLMLSGQGIPLLVNLAPALELTGAIVWAVLGVLALRLLPVARRLPSRFSLNEVRQAYAKSMSSLMDRAARDALTGAFNRGKLDSLLAEQVTRASHGTSLSLLMVDIDDFKAVNDSYGHLTGDEVLVGVVKAINSSVRGPDLVARFGGEEFVVVLPEANAEQALQVAQRVLHQVERMRIRRDGGDISVTCSIGVAEFFPTETPQTLLARADDALYASKAAGKNRVTVSDGGDRDEPKESGHFAVQRVSECEGVEG